MNKIRRIWKVIWYILFLQNILAYANIFTYDRYSEQQTNDIVQENRQEGTNAWWYSQPIRSEAILISKRIQGYTTQFSFVPTETIYFKINSLLSFHENYKLSIYRLGYYNGQGGRLIHEIRNIKSYVQPPCMYEPKNHLVDCSNWNVTVSWKIPLNTMTGVYVALASDQFGNKGSYIPFVIRRDLKIKQLKEYDILFKTSDTTWVAYNKFGSWNVYRGNGSFSFSSRAYKSSYNRPFANRLPKPNGQHENYIFGSEYAMLYWLEKHGYDVSYASCYDIERYSKDSLLSKSFNLLLSLGHDEYWTGGMKSAYLRARNDGVNLAFFSGNEMFWRILWQDRNVRYIPTSDIVYSTDGYLIRSYESNNSNSNNNDISSSLLNSLSSSNGETMEPRIIICRKESIDDVPISSSIEDWTGTFIDPRHRNVVDPPNELTGQFFMVNGFRNDSIHVRRNDSMLRFWRNTELQNTSRLPGPGYWTPIGILGYEWDIFSDDCYRPTGLFSLSWTTIRISHGLLESYGATYRGTGTVSHHISMYRYISHDYRPSLGPMPSQGSSSLVFASGTIQWAWALSNRHDGHNMSVDYNFQQATINLFADMHIQPANLQKEEYLHIASPSYDSIPPVSIIYPNLARRCSGPIYIYGQATDRGGGNIASVEVSFDNGTTWNIAKGRERWNIRYNLHSPEGKNCSKENTIHHLKYEMNSAPKAMILAAAGFITNGGLKNRNLRNIRNVKNDKTWPGLGLSLSSGNSHRENSNNNGNTDSSISTLTAGMNVGTNVGTSVGTSVGHSMDIHDLWIISRAVDDSGWIEGCCGHKRHLPSDEAWVRNGTNRIHLRYSCLSHRNK